MTDLLPHVIPVDEIKTAPQHVSTNDAELKASPSLDVDEFVEEETEEITSKIIDKQKDEEEEEQIIPKEIQADEEVFKDTKPKKKKRVISDAQREHLAQARKKALEVRRRKAHEKKLIKQQETRRKKKEEVTKKNLNAVHNPLESEDEEEEPTQHHRIKSHAFDDIDEDLLVQLQEKAIEKYEVKRKARKEVKKKKEKEVKKEEDIYQAVKKAVQHPDPDDMWSVCFQ